ncbi:MULTISPECIES: hypothetical protein [unclassified Bradyrhizobium]|uniref:hypothetical protein n=1 Tax=unclassified Bradyrhizobium TaxID=2631580 RepID=UPI002916464C|nr:MULTISPECIES: hypothetical protein [unclassified Bradyrhizobium]
MIDTMLIRLAPPHCALRGAMTRMERGSFFKFEKRNGVHATSRSNCAARASNAFTRASKGVSFAWALRGAGGSPDRREGPILPHSTIYFSPGKRKP